VRHGVGLFVLVPWLYLFEMIWHRRQVSGLDWVVLLSALCILGSAIVPVEIANPRYLIPLPWLAVLMVGVMLSRFLSEVPETTSSHSANFERDRHVNERG